MQGRIYVVPAAVVRATRRGKVWDKSGGRCHYCGVELHPFWSFTVDHIIAKGLGGTNALANLVAACPRCNVEKGDTLVEVPERFFEAVAAGAFDWDGLLIEVVRDA